MFKINLLSPQENVNSLVFIHGWGPGLWFYKVFTGWNFVDCFFPQHATSCCSILAHIVSINLWFPIQSESMTFKRNVKLLHSWQKGDRELPWAMQHPAKKSDFQMQCCLGPKLGLCKIKGSWKGMKLYFSPFDGIPFLSWDSDFIVTDFVVKPLFFQHSFISWHSFDKKNRVGLVYSIYIVVFPVRLNMLISIDFILHYG